MKRMQASASEAQQSIADMHHIPRKFAYTVNISKCSQYFAWLRSPACRMEKFLDNLETQRCSMIDSGDIKNNGSMFD